jgi:hypothetical protein
MKKTPAWLKSMRLGDAGRRIRSEWLDRISGPLDEDLLHPRPGSRHLLWNHFDCLLRKQVSSFPVTDGKETVLRLFSCGADGGIPLSGLVFDSTLPVFMAAA